MSGWCADHRSSRRGQGFFFVVFGVIVLIASFFTINPIWTYAYDPSLAVPSRTGTSGFADGMLRLIPRWEVVWFNHTYSLQHHRDHRDPDCVPRDRRDLSLRRSVDYGRQA
jgi:hypothetical protein